MTEPKIRFQEYNAEWVEYPLEDILTENLDPVATPREGYRRVGIYCHAKGTFQEDVPADKVLDVDTMYKIHKDNLIVNITFAWEHAIAIVKPEDEGMLVSHRFPEYEFNKGHIPSFYKYLILRPYMKNQLSLASPGGAGRNRVLNKKQFMQIPVYVPCEAEQQKIADFLSNVDEVIAASEEEATNLEQQKKAVMQKIFSQEVRFKKEDGSDFPDWEEKKIKELGNVVTGNTPSTKDVSNYGDEYLWVTPTDISTEPYIYSSNKMLSDKGWGKARKLPAGSILVTCIASIGKNCILAKEGSCNQQINAIIPFDNVNAYYVMQAIEYKTRDLEALGGNGGMKIVSKSLFEDFTVIAPSLPEQQLIADFLTSYDEAITAAKQELAKWKELKKGLLQQMFV